MSSNSNVLGESSPTPLLTLTPTPEDGGEDPGGGAGIQIVLEDDEPSSTVNNNEKVVLTSDLLLGGDLKPQAPSTMMTVTTTMPPPPTPSLNPVKKKNRLLVTPGKSMVEWMRLVSGLPTPPKPRKIRAEELGTHNTLGDVWMAIEGKVYDVSKYVNYHPGGLEEILKGAGSDGTLLFHQAHRWVNYTSILRGNFLGYLDLDSTIQGSFPLKPKTVFFEDEESVSLQIDADANCGQLSEESWTFGVLNRETLFLKVLLAPPKVWRNQIALMKTLADDRMEVRYGKGFRQAVITLRKPEPGRWTTLGSPSEEGLVDLRTLEDSHPATLTRGRQLTHNVWLYSAVLDESALIMGVPVGFHVQIKLKSTLVSRPFTPVVPSLRDVCPKNDRAQELHFIIKVYEDGRFTSALGGGGDSSSHRVEISYPKGSFDPAFLLNLSTLVLLAGGTGITPFVRIVQYLAQNRRKSLQLRRVLLLFFNESLEDVIMKEEWESFAKEEGDWFTFIPVISRDQGRISAELFTNVVMQACPDLDQDKGCKVLICGSPGFNAASKTAVKEQRILRIMDEPDGIFIFGGG